MLEEENIERLPGAHCYDFLAGRDTYEKLQEEDPGSFYLTDFLTQHFDRLVIKSLGIDRYPELLETYFGNYNRLIYLAQTDSDDLDAQARNAAAQLGLEYQRIFTGMGEMVPELDAAMQKALWQS